MRRDKIKRLRGVRGPLYSNRPFKCFFYYKARVLIISAIKAINMDRPRGKPARVYALRLKGGWGLATVLSERGQLLFLGYRAIMRCETPSFLFAY